MFRRDNSKVLTFLNVLLLIQIVGGSVSFLGVLAMILFPSAYVVVDFQGCAYPFFVIAVAILSLYLINNPLRKLFDVTHPAAEKLFNLCSIQTLNGLSCALLSLLVTTTGAANVEDRFLTIFRTAVVGGIFVLAIIATRKFRVFNRDSSATANYSNMVFGLSATVSVAWFINAMLDLMTYSGRTIGYYDPTISMKRSAFISLCLSFVFIGIVVAITKHANSKPAEQKKIVAEPKIEPAPLPTAVSEPKNEDNDPIKAMQKEIEDLKKQLAGKNKE